MSKTSMDNAVHGLFAGAVVASALWVGCRLLGVAMPPDWAFALVIGLHISLWRQEHTGVQS